MNRILVVVKRPTLERVAPAELARLYAVGVLSQERLEAGRASHGRTLALVLDLLRDAEVVQVALDEVCAAHLTGVDLVISVGGDGTALSVNHWLDETPLLAVNSDPERSIGHYTRCTATDVATLYAAWQAGRHRIESLHRLHVRTATAARPFLNDCLVCTANPGTMSRWILKVDGQQEYQGSSGIWVSTASGSTGAIASAGMAPVPVHEAALLYKVREPFTGRGPLRLGEDRQLPPRGLVLIAGAAGLAVYVDGNPLPLEVPPGTEVAFTTHPRPLRLVVPTARS